MGLPPTGKIVARVMLARACGCVQEFQHYEVDKYRPARQAKFQGTRCPACAAKVTEENKQAPAIPKGEVLKQLPPGTRVTLTRAADGSWGGTLCADGTSVQVVGVAREAGPGMQAVGVELARLWITAKEKASRLAERAATAPRDGGKAEDEGS
jgi:hypothetical protein